MIKKDAFTLVEVVAVIVIIGMLMGVAVNALMSVNGRNLKNDIYGVMSNLWWLRQKAIATHSDLQMKFYGNSTTVDSYCLCKGACPTLDSNCTYLQNANVLMPRQKLVSVVDASPPPYINANAVTGMFTVFQANGQVIQLDSPTGAKSANLTVYNGTGYVQESF